MTDISIIKIEDLSKVATRLIDKISDAVGGLYKPYQIKRVAKAEAEAEKIQAQAQVEITELQRRALARFVAEESKKQDNIEQIIAKAIPKLSDSSNPQNMDDDWITNFFDKCRIISDQEMQLLWSKVLAGEANSPGAYSKRTVTILGSLDKKDAELFNSLCDFSGSSDGLTPYIFDVQASIYNLHGINFNTLLYLDDIGLINFDSLAGFQNMDLPQNVAIIYQGIPLVLKFQNPNNNSLPIGKVTLTKTGQELSKVCTPKPIDGFFEYISQYWVKRGLTIVPFENISPSHQNTQ